MLIINANSMKNQCKINANKMQNQYKLNAKSILSYAYEQCEYNAKSIQIQCKYFQCKFSANSMFLTN